MQIGIRLHDVNTGLSDDLQTMAERAKTAREEGFSCVHLAFGKVIKGFAFDNCALNEGLAGYTRRVFNNECLDVAVLGCYLNLAHPDKEELSRIQSRYCGHIRVASLLQAGVVGTETGAPNAQYKTDAATHTKEALEIFINNLAPVVETAEKFGVVIAIEPVWKHIVYNAERAETVLKAVGSPNLRVIFDPVNLLAKENLDKRDEILDDFMNRLADDIAVVHLKDYIEEADDLKSVAAGTGLMDYKAVLSFIKSRKPHIYATLENTSNDNAVKAREHIEQIYREV